jgi:hypothetical protein
MLGLLPAVAAVAADLTIPNGAAVTQKRANTGRPQASKAQKTAPGRKRTEKKSRNKISSYNLSAPGLKHGTRISGKTGFGPGNGSIGLGTGLDTKSSGGSSLGPNNLSATPLGTGFKADTANNTGGNADCRETPAKAGPRRREMTACFVHKLDKSWKTQTYVSRRSADGNTGWGGGLAVGYDY